MISYYFTFSARNRLYVSVDVFMILIILQVPM